MTAQASPTRPRRTVRELIEARDPAFMASARRTVEAIRADLERLAQLPEGHPDLTDRDDDGNVEAVHTPEAIRAVLEGCWQAPPAQRPAPAAPRPEPAVQGPDATTWKRHWTRQLHRLRGLPLLAVGAGPDRKAPANVRNGELLGRWQTTVHTQAQIETAHKRICGAGTRTGKAADGLLVLDVDGGTALSWLLERGCDPVAAQTWQIHRNTDNERLKVAWRLSEDQQALLGQLKTKVETCPAVKDSEGKVLEKGQAVELFHGVGQVVVLGEHPTTRGFYWWPEGMGPEKLAPIPPVWWEAVLQIAQPTAAPTQSASKKVGSSSKGDWRRLERCPICGRDERLFCSIHNDGRTIRCFHGATFSPVQTHGALRTGQEITDREGTVWAFCREQQAAGETFSIFVAPDPERRRQQLPVAAAPAATQLAAQPPVGEDAALALAAEPAGQKPIGSKAGKVRPGELLSGVLWAMGQPRLNIRTRQVHVGGGAVIGAPEVLSSDDVARLYLRLSSAEHGALTWAKEPTFDAVMSLASAAAFDPLQQEILSIAESTQPLPLGDWERLDLLLFNHPDPIAAQFMPRFLVSAVARLLEPGCKADQLPVLVGKQGIGKSELGKSLFGKPWWIDNLGHRLEVDDVTRCHRAWGCELAELDGLTRRADVEALKAFLSRQTDVVRRPYGRSEEVLERGFVFWGTSNSPPLRDMTGNRRFVCIALPPKPLPLLSVAEMRGAIWSRAVQQYRAGFQWWSTPAEAAAIADRNADHLQADPWHEVVAGWLKGPQARAGKHVSLSQLHSAVEVPPDRQNNATATRLRQIAESLGWSYCRRRLANGERLRAFWPPEVS